MYTPPAIKPTNGFATASLVFGIVGIALGWCSFLIPNILAVVFGHIALSRARSGGPGYGKAVAGLATGYGFLILVVIGGFLAAASPR